MAQMRFESRLARLEVRTPPPDDSHREWLASLTDTELMVMIEVREAMDAGSTPELSALEVAWLKGEAQLSHEAIGRTAPQGRQIARPAPPAVVPCTSPGLAVCRRYLGAGRRVMPARVSVIWDRINRNRPAGSG